MTPPIHLRPATASDVPAIGALYQLSRATFLPYALSPHTPVQVQAWIAKHWVATGNTLLAVCDEQIVGMLVIEQQAQAGWIDQLYLHPAFVRHGLGTRLLQHALHTLTPPVRLYTFQQNTAARAFYEHHGFRAIAFGDGSANEEHCPDVLYEWGTAATP
ncbi:MAG TPA: GNAT family N-acetyltransferase [Anaerolineales bacterium]|nr:GNAT family N-acetyltransferase [Anaerolineales bacterium]